MIRIRRLICIAIVMIGIIASSSVALADGYEYRGTASYNSSFNTRSFNKINDTILENIPVSVRSNTTTYGAHTGGDFTHSFWIGGVKRHEIFNVNKYTPAYYSTSYTGSTYSNIKNAYYTAGMTVQGEFYLWGKTPRSLNQPRGW